jgi:hypothetical protein
MVYGPVFLETLVRSFWKELDRVQISEGISRMRKMPQGGSFLEIVHWCLNRSRGKDRTSSRVFDGSPPVDRVQIQGGGADSRGGPIAQ